MRKRIISILLVAVLLTSCAIAESLKGMTDDQILALYDQVIAEIMARSLWRTAELPMGTYKCGVDIPEGTFLLTCLDDSALICVYQRDEDIATRSWVSNGWPKNGEQFKMTLSEGMSFTIEIGKVRIEHYEGVLWE